MRNNKYLRVGFAIWLAAVMFIGVMQATDVVASQCYDDCNEFCEENGGCRWVIGVPTCHGQCFDDTWYTPEV